MKVFSQAATAADWKHCKGDVTSLLKGCDLSPDFVAVHHRASAVAAGDFQHTSLNETAMHCASSCQGSMQNSGVTDVGIFAISDPDGDYGTACATFEQDVIQTARGITETALMRAGRVGEAPDLVWVSFTPGCEEDAIAGIEAAVGKDVPIIGGSAADDTISGDWTVSDGAHCTGNGLVVSVLFCSTPIHFAYQNGYEPTENVGTVTRASGRRIFEIDDKPAAEVYASWNHGAIQSAVGETQVKNILSEATLWPLGRKIGDLGGVPNYLLAHPSLSHPDGSLELFAEVKTGEELTQMTGDKAALAARAGRVASFALKAGEVAAGGVAGALMVYCGGCMLAVQDRLEQVYTGVDAALSGAPFLGTFTFGEQGAMHVSGNRHGNLMISCIVFTNNA